MRPVREYSALVDLLDRALQKGLFVSADVIVSVADVPLIGLNLRLALANIETMLAYGMMRDWDEAHRVMRKQRPDRGLAAPDGMKGGETVGQISEQAFGASEHPGDDGDQVGQGAERPDRRGLD